MQGQCKGSTQTHPSKAGKSAKLFVKALITHSQFTGKAAMSKQNEESRAESKSCKLHSNCSQSQRETIQNRQLASIAYPMMLSEGLGTQTNQGDPMKTKRILDHTCRGSVRDQPKLMMV